MRAYLEAPRPIAFAHRGGAALWPENTLEAFEGAMRLGYRYIETDVHVTRDGHLVAFHDATLDRTTDGHGAIAARSMHELRRLDAGYRFTRDGETFPYRGRGIRIPTLAEALALDPALRFNVEMKPRGHHVGRVVWDFVEKHGAHDRLLVASAHAPTGQFFSRLSGGRVATSAGRSEVLAFWLATKVGATAALSLRYDALQVPEYHGRLRVVTPRLLHAAHARGLQVHVWTVDEPADLQRLAQMGVDGLMTDRPDRLASDATASGAGPP